MVTGEAPELLVRNGHEVAFAREINGFRAIRIRRAIVCAPEEAEVLAAYLTQHAAWLAGG